MSCAAFRRVHAWAAIWVIVGAVSLRPGEARAASVSSIQSGTLVMSTGSGSAQTSNVTITSVDLTKSILFFNYRCDSVNPDDGQVRGQLTSSTNIQFYRSDDAGLTAVTIRWYVATFASGVTVQRGTVEFTSATVNVTITAVDLSHSLALGSLSTTAGSVNYGTNDYFRARLTTTTNLELAMNGSGGFADWQVVEFTDSSVQRGTGSMTTTTQSATVSITAVDLSKSIVLLTWRTSLDSATGANFLRARFSATNQLTIDRGVGTSATIDYAWQVIQFTDNTSVQSGNMSFSSSTTTNTASLTATDLNRSVPLLSTAAGRGGGSHSYSADDAIGPGMFTTELTDDHTLTAARQVHRSSTADISWFVIEFDQAPAAPSSLGAAAYTGGSSGIDHTPTLQFTQSDVDAADTLKFQIQVDDSSDFSSPVTDYTSSALSQGSTSFTVGQAAGSGTYTTGAQGQQLARSKYYWRVRSNDGVQNGAWATANGGAVAFYIGLPTAGVCP